MSSTARWPQVARFRDHWTWRPDWTAHRPRLLWYLTFEDAPDLRAAAAPSREALLAAGADVVPPEWLHLTVTDVGFYDELDDWAVRTACESVRAALRQVPAPELTVGPVRVLPDAVVLPAEPVGPLRTFREAVWRASTEVGIAPADDIGGHRWPHVSLCYINGRTDHERLREIVDEADPRTVVVRCDRMSQVLVTRRHGHYRWEVVDEVWLDSSPTPAESR